MLWKKPGSWERFCPRALRLSWWNAVGQTLSLIHIFLTKVLDIPAELLYVSVYEDDDEAYDIWTKEVGIDPSHMVRFGKEDNFWEHGLSLIHI